MLAVFLRARPLGLRRGSLRRALWLRLRSAGVCGAALGRAVWKLRLLRWRASPPPLAL